MKAIFPKLVLASHNAGKCREFKELLSPFEIDVISQGDLAIAEADEPHATFVENALAKARHASRHAGLPALADDSGICVAALGDMPGVKSARFSGEPRSDERNNQLLIELLSAHQNRCARYYCALVLTRHAEDPMPIIACGMWAGTIIDTPRGTNGFGYDPYFLTASGKTAAELSPDEKNAISHRGMAVASLFAQLKHWQESL